MHRTIVALSAVAFAALAARASGSTLAHAPVQGTAFHLIRGTDTLATERFTRTATRLTAELGGKMGGRVAYSAELAPDASVTRMEVRGFASPTDTAAAQHSVATFQGDSVFAETMAAGQPASSDRVGTTRGAVPFLNPSPSLMEQIVRRARAIGGTQVQVPVLIMGAGQTVPATVNFVGADSASLALGGTEVRVRVDAAGSVLGGIVPSQSLTIVRVGGR